MNRSICLVGLSALSCVGFAQSFTEGFDNVAGLSGSGWAKQNLSTTTGTTDWFQGNPAVFPALSGATNSYVGANFNATTGTNTISDWLFAPTRTLNNGDTFSFFTRTVTANPFPDRLQLRMSLNGSSVNAGATSTDVGDFTTLLLDINPNLQTGAANYPETWTQFSVTLSGLGGPTSGRLAFRYFVTNGGPTGANSNYIGIDDVAYTANPVPEPATMAVLGLGAIALIRRRRK